MFGWIFHGLLLILLYCPGFIGVYWVFTERRSFMARNTMAWVFLRTALKYWVSFLVFENGDRVALRCVSRCVFFCAEHNQWGKKKRKRKKKKKVAVSDGRHPPVSIKSSMVESRPEPIAVDKVQPPHPQQQQQQQSLNWHRNTGEFCDKSQFPPSFLAATAQLSVVASSQAEAQGWSCRFWQI